MEHLRTRWLLCIIKVAFITEMFIGRSQVRGIYLMKIMLCKLFFLHQAAIDCFLAVQIHSNMEIWSFCITEFP